MASHEFIPYLRALAQLKARLDASPDEIAMWIWLGPNEGGLAAYDNPNRPGGPSRFHYIHELHGFDYLSPLQGCYFRGDDGQAFQPVKRFMTAAVLVEKWRSQCGGEDAAKAFILARIKESRLEDFHPVFGCTVASSPEDDYPPLTSAMFSVIEVETIEVTHFPESPLDTTSPRHRTKSVSSGEIIDRFMVVPPAWKNKTWWDQRMRDSKRYGLIGCRASAGRAKTPSRWYPDLIAAWLVGKDDKHGHMSVAKVALILRQHFPDCASAAELLCPSRAD